MQDLPKRVIIGSMAVAALVAVAAIADIVTGVPFSGKSTMVMDIMFIICSGIVCYLAYDAYKDLS
ncbi:hypothetical protein [Planctomicrobium sp. SH664]|uniref:hypothetical protein n=1 Tax=Planctomicrobium sp. SH664 TaxID=3448125 RepID=UPI003F5B6B2F